MTTPSRRYRVFLVGLALTVSLGIAGCGQPTEVARQNRRLADALLTAVTTKKIKELDKSKALIDQRLADGLMSPAHHRKLADLHALAKSGKWVEAEDALYRLREAEPFPD